VRCAVGPRREFRVRRDDPELLLPGEGLFTLYVPTFVEDAAVGIAPLACHVMRRMRRAERQIGEERLVGGERLLRADPCDRLVRQIL